MFFILNSQKSRTSGYLWKFLSKRLFEFSKLEKSSSWKDLTRFLQPWTWSWIEIPRGFSSDYLPQNYHYNPNKQIKNFQYQYALYPPSCLLSLLSSSLPRSQLQSLWRDFWRPAPKRDHKIHLWRFWIWLGYAWVHSDYSKRGTSATS